MANEIRINQAHIDDDGMLVVRGEILATPKLQIVTLNRRFTTRSSKDGEFSFKIRRTPFLCRFLVQAKELSQAGKVDNCQMNDMRLLPDRPR